MQKNPKAPTDSSPLDPGKVTTDVDPDVLADDAKLWLAHDGLWFQAVERVYGTEVAIQMDIEAWQAFTVIEAKRIMKRLGLAPGGGIEALARALAERMYVRINEQAIVEQDEHRLVYHMQSCRVQSARQRKGLPDFACRPVGIVEYTGFAKTIDPRIETRCLGCPPDPAPEHAVCAWEFTLPRDSRGQS